MRLHSTLLLLCLAVATVHAETSAPAQLTLPSQQEATEAIVKMLDLGEMQDQVTAKLGTCIAATEAEHAGQVACTVAIGIGAGTSETQADFYRSGSTWVAQPSSSQEKLPFPDPALL
ncbi:hypothetical protein A9179_11170 [Pseudomonas alcaligenes]|uniref:UrcA family protein n=1 Tax=Aquipseudomonas alcaligenes TaxID=43263 RepID=A0ABR7S1C9_AQUAC|nr:hypothetical protein [Pseudomonas alcaligenes]MBC9250837.1 hypothetical protein [Pseudomonas alcaligenes]